MFKGRIEGFFRGVDIEGIENGEKSISEPEKKHINSQYDGEIAYLDEHLGILFNKLKSMGLYNKSIIIITSDHGEELGEHNLVDHGHHLYEPEIKIPLLIKTDNVIKKEINTNIPVQNMDIFPTILNLLNIPIPDSSQGNSLFSKVNHPIISECYGVLNRDLISIIEDNLKFIHSTNGKDELFNISNDPQENYNIINSNPETATLLKNRINNWKKSIKVKEFPIESIPKLDAETIRKLRSLGYIK